MNFLPAQRAGEHGSRSPGTRLVGAAAQLPRAAPLKLGIRPEYVTLAAPDARRRACRRRSTQAQDIGTYWLLTAAAPADGTLHPRAPASARRRSRRRASAVVAAGRSAPHTCFYANDRAESHAEESTA